MYYKGDKIAKNYPKAVQLFSKACDLGHTNACYNLAYMYENAQEVKDSFKAVELYEKLCNQGISAA